MGFFSPWSSFEVGDRISILFEVSYVDDGYGPHSCLALGYNKRFQLTGIKIQDGHFFTATDLRVCDVGEMMVLGFDNGSNVWPHLTCSYSKVCSCIELCAGAGFTMEGISAAGFRPIASIEANERFRELHSAMHSNPYICCDIGSEEALRHIFDLHAEGSTVMAGINCQPYSIAGDKRREQDLRASSLPKALTFAFLIRAQIVVLECTPLAQSDQFVQDTIHEFACHAGMKVVQRVLHLGSCWASRRDRWWCVLAKHHFAIEDIPDMPVMKEFQRVSAIMPYIKHWPNEQIAQLVLSLCEHGKFLDYGGGLVPHYLNMDSHMATALHAWGNQVYPCKCGCRGGFSEERMQSKGLHGQLIPSNDLIERMGTQIPCCRHLHPIEVILLCGAFPGRQVTGDMRLALAAAGQMASPMHSVWVFGHIQHHLQVFFAVSPVVEPIELLKNWQSEVLHARDLLWPRVPSNDLVPTRTVSLPQPLTIDVSVGVSNASGLVDVVTSPGTTVGELVIAEATLCRCDQKEYQVFSLDDNGVLKPISSDQLLNNGDCIVLGPLASDVLCEHVSDPLSLPPLTDSDLMDVAIEPAVSEVIEPQVDVTTAAAEHDCPIIIEDPEKFQKKPEKFGIFLGVGEADPDEVSKAEFDFTMWQDPLSKLSRAGLLQMLCPQVLTVGAFQGIRKHTISGVLRRLVLKNQEGAMGDDEMLLLLHAASQSASTEQKVVVWDPLVMTALAKQRQGHVVFQWASSLASQCTIVTAIVVGMHWVPLVWRKDGNLIFGFSCFVPQEFRSVLQELHAYICKICECEVSDLTFASHAPSVRFCGTAAVQYVVHLLTHQELRFMDGDLESQYHRDVAWFRSQCLTQVPRPWIWGLGHGEGQSQLAALLRQHGVEESEALPRSAKVIDSLGRDAVVKALKSQNPWKNIKWLANQKVPPYQIIQPAELQQAIAIRSQSGAPVGNRAMKMKGKGKGKKGANVGEVNPDSLRLEAGVFVGDDHPLGQLKVSQIGPVASGVVLATLDQAMPYLTSGKQVSIGSLGIVVLNPPPVAITFPLIGAKVKFPVFCVANAEPLIVEGDLYQLGGKPVIKHSVANTLQLKTIETCVVKIVTFRDGVDQWSQVVSHPVQHILAAVPQLNKCSEEMPCDCPKWHAEAGGVSDPVMEVWNRQWLTSTFVQVKPTDADMYSVSVRVPKCLELALLTISGIDSICFEPRSLDGRKPSDDYSVVWLPKASAAQALLFKQTNMQVIGLARLGSKWGLRCKESDASTLHAIVKPDSEFLPAGQRQLYLIGPLPFGTVRQSLVEAFRSIGWSARPLHAVPAVRNVSGVMWKVQATTGPPTAVLALKDGEAVITRFDQSPAAEPHVRPVIGSSATLNICKQPAGNEKPLVDPFQICDPWAKPTQPDVVMETSGVKDVVAGLEQRVFDAVIAQLPKQQDGGTATGPVNARVEELERQVFQISTQQQCLHQTFQEQSVAHQTQLNDLQVQFQAQHGQLEAAVSEQGHHIVGLSNNFQMQLEKQQSQLDRMFTQQMARIEDLLGANKKPRKD